MYFHSGLANEKLCEQKIGEANGYQMTPAVCPVLYMITERKKKHEKFLSLAGILLFLQMFCRSGLVSGFCWKGQEETSIDTPTAQRVYGPA